MSQEPPFKPLCTQNRIGGEAGESMVDMKAKIWHGGIDPKGPCTHI